MTANNLASTERPATAREGGLSEDQIRVRLEGLARAYPPEMVAEQLTDSARVAFNIWLALDGRSPETVSICDIGGGIGLFSIGCKALGCRRVVLIDDFRDEINTSKGDGILALHKRHGVEVHSRDVIADGLGVEGPFDIVTTFDSMEHWHHSPKRLFRQVMRQLAPGGTFVLGVPNCANLRKRLTLPFGVGKWSAFEEWYGPETFRGHVREPDVSDLHAIARDMGLTATKVIGRNWTGHTSPNGLIRLAASLADIPLRALPSLCGTIYLAGRNP